jgi:hypothetical protein
MPAETQPQVRARKPANVIEKGFGFLANVQQGCTLLLINLFLCGFLVWGAYGAFVAVRLETAGDTVPGMVVAMDEHTIDGISWSPVVEYEVAGRTYTFTSGHYSNPPAYSVGDRVDVRYDIANPGMAAIDSWFERWLFPLIMIVVIPVLAVVLNVVLIRAWRRGEDISFE